MLLPPAWCQVSAPPLRLLEITCGEHHPLVPFSMNSGHLDLNI